MKKLMLAFLSIAISTSIFAQKKVSDVAKFSTESYDFGKIKQNVPVTAIFTVTNTSNKPLIIEQANPTCGCTISDYTKSPIAPGQTGTIKATYNASALGAIHKNLTVKFAEIDDIKTISLAGEVVDNTTAAKVSTVDKMKVSADGDSKIKSTNADGSKTVEKNKKNKSKKKTTPADSNS